MVSHVKKKDKVLVLLFENRFDFIDPPEKVSGILQSSNHTLKTIGLEDELKVFESILYGMFPN